MKPCKADMVRTCFFLLFLLATVPAYCQRGTIGVDFGETSDKFGSVAAANAGEFGLDGQLTVKAADKNGWPNVIVGGELRVPTDTSSNATEFAIFGGPHFPIGNFSVGFNAEVRKIYLPSYDVDNTLVPRFEMELLEIPLVLKYKFGPAKRAFVELQGGPEFTPRLIMAKAPVNPVPKPNFDYGYTVRGTVGYTFGKWYAKATCQTRYFNFVSNPANPSNLYNWKSNQITGGVGLIF
jgi:hypothetical protein